MLAGDENDHTDPSWLNFSIIALCAAILWHMMQMDGSALRHFLSEYAFVRPPGAFASWPWGHLPVAALTCIFLHGGIAHLLGNGFFLLVFGDNIEYAFGRWRYLIFFLLCGVISSWAQFLFIDPEVPLLGMSGAVAGVLGAYLRIFPDKKVRLVLPEIFWLSGHVFWRISAFWYIAFWFAGNLLSAVATFGADGGGVAFFAHMGGFLLGYVLAPHFRDPEVGIYERAAIPLPLFEERFAYLNRLRRKPEAEPAVPAVPDKIVIEGDDISRF